MTGKSSSSKAELLAALRASRAEVVAIVRALPAAALEQGRYESGWNGRQILAHLASAMPATLDMGAPRWPPSPPMLGTPRRSRGAPRSPVRGTSHRDGGGGGGGGLSPGGGGGGVPGGGGGTVGGAAPGVGRGQR